LERNGLGAECHLGTALGKYNGGMQYLDTYVGLKVEDIDKAVAKYEMKAKNLVPFAVDIEGALQCINTAAGGEIVNFDTVAKEVDERLKMNYGEYLESIRDRILSHKLEFEEGLGLYSNA